MTDLGQTETFHGSEQDAKILLEVSENLADGMPGIEMGTLEEKDKLQNRGW